MLDSSTWLEHSALTKRDKMKSINRMVEQTQNLHNDDGHRELVIDLYELLEIIWKERFVIIFFTALFAVISIFYAKGKPDIYLSDALLAPVQKENAGGLGSLASQFGGLASLAGVNLGGGSSDKTQLTIEVLKSRQFAHEFIEKHSILPELIAVESWNSLDNTLVYNNDLYDCDTAEWKKKEGEEQTTKPTMQEAYKVFSSIFDASMDKETGMVTVSIEHISPFLAQQWVTWIVQDINETMKQRDVKEAQRSSDFLQQQLQKTEIAAIRQVLYKLIEEQTKTIMFAEVREEYVFKTIDKALVPEERIKPKRALIVTLGTLLGAFITTLFFISKHFIKKSVR